VRLSGSADLYEEDGREPFASINFITAHDGFTLRDLVSYNDKHNEANGEDNRDGTDDNRSWNCGTEGDTDDPEIQELRLRQQRNFLTTLLVSQGTPMLLGGDELNRTQGGNNNGWCQDSEISWYDWNQDAERDRMHAFVRRLIRLRREHCTFRRETFLRGRELDDMPLPDVWWFRADGRKMTPRDWEHGEAVLGMFLNGETIMSRGPRGETIDDDSFVVLFNAHFEDRQFRLPRQNMGRRWELELSTSEPDAVSGSAAFAARELVDVMAHSITILKRGE
jgi:isoamylase